MIQLLLEEMVVNDDVHKTFSKFLYDFVFDLPNIA